MSPTSYQAALPRGNYNQLCNAENKNAIQLCFYVKKLMFKINFRENYTVLLVKNAEEGTRTLTDFSART